MEEALIINPSVINLNFRCMDTLCDCVVNDMVSLYLRIDGLLSDLYNRSITVFS